MFYWALLSAVFASLTAIFAKIGLDGIDSDFATLVRTAVILCAIAWFVYYTDKWRDLSSLSSKNWSFLTLSGLAPVRPGYDTSAPCKWARRPNWRRWIS